MAIADGSRVALRYVKETTFGTTPASALKNLRFVSESIKTNTQTTSSSEVVSDRQTAAIVRTQLASGGDINVEWSYAALDDLLEGALMNTWALNTPASGTDRLDNGTTKTSFTLEKEFTDVSEFEAFKGCRVSGFNFTVRPGEIVTGGFSFLGLKGTPAAATVGTGGPTAAPTNTVWNAVDNVVLTEGGSAIDNVREVTLNYDNGLREQAKVGSVDLAGIGIGPITLTGTLVRYFETRTLYEKYANYTTSSMTIEFQDAAGTNELLFNIPAIKYTDGQVLAEGRDGDIVAQLSWSAFKDSVTGKTLRIERTP